MTPLGAALLIAMAAASPLATTGQQKPEASPAAPRPALETYPVRYATHVAAAAATLKEGDLVLGVVAQGQARAYPLSALWDEEKHTVNDELGEIPIAVSMCPLAGLGAAYDRRAGNEVLDIGSVVPVDRGMLVLYDNQTHTTWNLLSGEAVSGKREGQQLRRANTTFTTWGHWRALHPDTTLYAGTPAGSGLAIDDQLMRRILLVNRGPLRDRDWVLGFPTSESSEAVLVRQLVDRRVANIQMAQLRVVVYLTEDLTTSAAWDRSAAGKVLTFRLQDGGVVDAETRSSWDLVTGRALEGALKGQQLNPIRVAPLFWHAWKAQRPDATVLDVERLDEPAQ